jgi:hypothetical protein
MFLNVGKNSSGDNILEPMTLQMKTFEDVYLKYIDIHDIEVRAIHIGNTLILVSPQNNTLYDIRMIPMNIAVLMRDVQSHNPRISESFSATLQQLLINSAVSIYLKFHRPPPTSTVWHDQFIDHILKQDEMPEPGIIQFIPDEEQFIKWTCLIYNFEFVRNGLPDGPNYFMRYSSDGQQVYKYTYYFRPENGLYPRGYYMRPNSRGIR